MKVLIIDDNKDLVDTLVSFFTIKGIQCKTAQNGKVGLELLAKEQFDITLMDLNMPLVSGLDIYDRLKKSNIVKKTKVIIMTGQPVSDMEAREMMYMGILRIVKKPFVLAELYNEMIKLHKLLLQRNIKRVTTQKIVSTKRSYPFVYVG
ncbi:MAG: response regulator [Candidatus Nitrosotenuis sp.]